MAERFADRVEVSPDHDLSKRVATLSAVLEEEQFTPRIRRKNGAVQIHLFNCHFHGVAPEHESVCAFDSHLISRILGIPVSLEKCVAWGDSICFYVTSKPKTRSKVAAAAS